MVQIKICDFSKAPLMRHCSVSEFSGEQYYHDILNQVFKDVLAADDILEINLDGVDGYSPSFIDEIFGNLVYDFSLKNVLKKVRIVSNEEPEWITSIREETYPLWEERRTKKMVPKITVPHNAWWRLTDQGILEQSVWNKVVDG